MCFFVSSPLGQHRIENAAGPGQAGLRPQVADALSRPDRNGRADQRHEWACFAAQQGFLCKIASLRLEIRISAPPSDAIGVFLLKTSSIGEKRP